MRHQPVSAPRPIPRRRRPAWLETGWTALRLGLTSFGGPAAHIGYFRETYVRRLRWLDENAFADLTAMCQFLPGPASSQLGMAIGMRRAGIPGALAAWAGFTLPSAALMVLFAFGYAAVSGGAASGVLHGLQLAAVAVVAYAVWSMSRTLTPDVPRIAMALATAACALLLPGMAGQLLPLALCGLAAWLMLRRRQTADATGQDEPAPPAPQSLLRRTLPYLAAFAALLAALPLLAAVTDNPYARLADIGYRAGALVFGGGHVVLPMLEHESVRHGLIGEAQFVAGYGAAQAVPGPLFTFAAFVGASSSSGWDGAARALAMLGAVFLPSFLLVAGVMPYWERIRSGHAARAVLAGVNAAVVGLLLAALYDPVWTAAVHGAGDAGAAAAAFAILLWRRVPPLAVTALCALAGWIILGP